MKARLLILVLMILFLAVPIQSAGFSIKDGVVANPICNTETDVTSFTITNAVSEKDTYTVTLSGSASSWSVAAPAGFSLDSGESKTITIYSTPLSSTQPGDYNLRIIVSGNKGGSDAITKTITVQDCHAISLTASETEKKLCAGETTKFDFSLSNEGKFIDTYSLSIDGSAAKWATLGQKQVIIAPKESKAIAVFVAPDYDKVGVYDLTLAVKSDSSEQSIATQTVSLNLEGCYDHVLTLKAPTQSICDGAETRVPVTIINKGLSTSEFSLKVSGASWASVDQPSFLLQGGAENKLTLLLNPPAVSEDKEYKITITSSDLKGKVSKTVEFPITIRNCHASSLNIKDSEVKICAGKSASQEVMLVNEGDAEQTYALSIEGPAWSGLTKASASLKPKESSSFELKLNPQNANPGKYIVKVGAGKASDSIRVDLLPEKDCYSLSLGTINRISVSPNKPAKVDVDVENTGAEEATYSFSVSGSGANLVKMNPASLTLKPGKKETLFLYVTASSGIAKGNYDITLTAKQDGGKDTVSKSTKIYVDSAAKSSISGNAILSKIKGLKFDKILVYAKQYLTWIILAAGIIFGIIIFWKAGAFKNLKDWLNRAEGEPKLVWNDKPKKAKKKPEKKSLWKKFNDWLDEDVPEKEKKQVKEEKKKVEKVKEKEEGLLSKFNKWLEEEPVAEKKADKKSKDLSQLDFGVEELEEPEDKRTKKVIEYIKMCREKKFKDKIIRQQLVKSGWEDSVISSAFKKIDKKVKKKGLWMKFNKWLEEE